MTDRDPNYLAKLLGQLSAGRLSIINRLDAREQLPLAQAHIDAQDAEIGRHRDTVLWWEEKCAAQAREIKRLRIYETEHGPLSSIIADQDREIEELKVALGVAEPAAREGVIHLECMNGHHYSTHKDHAALGCPECLTAKLAAAQAKVEEQRRLITTFQVSDVPPRRQPHPDTALIDGAERGMRSGVVGVEHDGIWGATPFCVSKNNVEGWAMCADFRAALAAIKGEE